MIIHQYKLLPLVRNALIYVEIHKGMYGLPQAGNTENDLLTECLAPKGYFRCTHTQTRTMDKKWHPIFLPLVIDNFGVKYVGKEHPKHLIPSIRELFPVAEARNRRLYCGIKLKWDCHKLTLDISIP